MSAALTSQNTKKPRTDLSVSEACNAGAGLAFIGAVVGGGITSMLGGSAAEGMAVGGGVGTLLVTPAAILQVDMKAMVGVIVSGALVTASSSGLAELFAIKANENAPLVTVDFKGNCDNLIETVSPVRQTSRDNYSMMLPNGCQLVSPQLE